MARDFSSADSDVLLATSSSTSRKNLLRLLTEPGNNLLSIRPRYNSSAFSKTKALLLEMPISSTIARLEGSTSRSPLTPKTISTIMSNVR